MLGRLVVWVLYYITEGGVGKRPCV